MDTVRRTVVLAVLGMLCLTGCRVDATVSVKMAKNGSGTVTVVVRADADLVRRAPQAVDALRLDDLRRAGWTVEGPAASADGGREVRLSRAFVDPRDGVAILNQLSGPAGPVGGWVLATRRTNGVTTTRFGGTFRLVGGTAGFGDAALVKMLGGEPLQAELKAAGTDLAQSFGLTVEAALPGTTKEPTSWTADLGAAAGTEAGQSFAVSTTHGRSTQLAERIAQIAPWALAAWGALILGVVAPIAWLISRRRQQLES